MGDTKKNYGEKKPTNSEEPQSYSCRVCGLSWKSKLVFVCNNALCPDKYAKKS